MNKALSYVYDFLSMVFEEKSLKGKIRNVVLFGSVAKKSYDKDSDVDLFFDVKSDADVVENSLRKVLKNFEVGAEKTWRLKGIELPIKFIVGSLGDKEWSNIKDEIISSGIVLYGDYKEMPKDIKHYMLFYYSLSNLDRKSKMKLIRRMFGYVLKKGKKEYKQKGFLEGVGGVKLASNVVLVSFRDAVKVKSIFSEFKVKYRIMEAWLRE